MALNRDIYWVGRQWAVTGYGLQAIDQKQKSKFDIEASRLWEDDLLENLRAQPWFNPEDFSKGLSVARARHPEPSRLAAAPAVTASPPEESEPIEAPKPAPELERRTVVVKNFKMRFEGWPAKFVPMWRVRIKR
jgi:hypothetical protein